MNKFDNDTRSSAAASYLTPVEHIRHNWLTLVEHTATRILFDSARPHAAVRATGVQFAVTPLINSSMSFSDATIYTAYASREVVLAAGAIRTPALLQLSGIGDASLLRSLDIDILLDLKGVGKNLQEQTNAVMGVFGNEEFATQFGGGGPDTVRPSFLHFISVRC